MIAGLDQDAVDAVADHFGDGADSGGDDDRSRLEGLLDGDQEAIRPKERQDDALRVFQPGSPRLAAHRRVEEEDVEGVLDRARPWRRSRLDAIGQNLLDRPPEKAAIQVLIEKIVRRADDQADAAGQPAVEARQRVEETRIMQADRQGKVVARRPHDGRQGDAGKVIQMYDLRAVAINDVPDGVRGPGYLVRSAANRHYRHPLCFRKGRRQLRDVDGGAVRSSRRMAGIDQADLHAVDLNNVTA